MKSETYPLAVPVDLYGELREAAEKTGLSVADTMRQSMKLGLPKLVEQLARSSGRVTNVEPIPPADLDKLYREREDDTQSVRRMIAAQPKGAE